MTSWKVWAAVVALAVAGCVGAYYHGKSVQKELDKTLLDALAAQPPVVKRDTTWLPGKTVHVTHYVPSKPDTLPPTDTTHILPGQLVVFDDTINGVWLGIEYETPSSLHPLGIFTAIDVKCPEYPAVHDSVFVNIHVPYEVKVTDWRTVSLLSFLGSTILYIVFVLSAR